MKETKSLMGMHITVEIVDKQASQSDFDDIYNYFTYIDNKFSTYKDTSEITKINTGRLHKDQYSRDMKAIFELSTITKQETNGYFDIYNKGKYDPSGIVKGWAILRASELLKKKKFKNYYIDAGGDVQVSGQNAKGKPWTVGIQNPFDKNEIIKILSLKGDGIATSGTALRGQHIYNPHNLNKSLTDVISITVIGPNVYEADRFATAAFAMGLGGITFIESMKDFEGYMIDKNKIATSTSGFKNYVVSTQQLKS